MCGLIGGAVPAGRVLACLPAIGHRGPDASRAATAGALTLGHTRLAIQDLTDASSQPWATRDGSTLVTYNGEAWRPADLRAHLPRHAWLTSGDTEPVAELLADRGAAALPLRPDVDLIAYTAVHHPRSADLRHARLVVSPEEAVAKARSLSGVLIPDTSSDTAKMLTREGWHDPAILHRWHVWTLIGAFASPVTDGTL